MPDQLKSTNRPRATARINSRLDKNLAAYMAAAGAAGVSLLAFPQTAEASIVYTPANSTLHGSMNIDLNHDGIADFTIKSFNISHLFGLVVVPDVSGNAIRAAAGGGAAAGFFGVPVANGEKFVTNTFYSEGVMMAGGYAYGTFSTVFGPWVNTHNRYLGLKFKIQGQIHYGWARLNVGRFSPVVLTGFAYETTPNTPIVEGHISGPEHARDFAPADLPASTAQFASLGVLAQGAPGMAVWRREDDGVAG